MRFPSGFDIKNPKMFVTLYSNQKFSTPRQPLLFFDVVKPRRKEYLLSQKIILSDLDSTSRLNYRFKVEKILKGSLNTIPSHSRSRENLI